MDVQAGHFLRQQVNPTLVQVGGRFFRRSFDGLYDAVRRAQENEVDFGFGGVPTLTLEDVIVAKLYALRARPVRAKDLDDLQSIFAAEPAADRPYLAGQLRRFHITIPREARPFLPDWLVAMARA